MSHFVVRLYKGKKRITERERERSHSDFWSSEFRRRPRVYGSFGRTMYRIIILLLYDPRHPRLFGFTNERVQLSSRSSNNNTIILKSRETRRRRILR